MYPSLPRPPSPLCRPKRLVVASFPKSPSCSVLRFPPRDNTCFAYDTGPALRAISQFFLDLGVVASTHVPATDPCNFTQVIRALYDYEARSSQELSFSRGDFFHVIGREEDVDWYEACNPALPDACGLVPVAFFQALGRTERDSAQSDGSRPHTATKNPDHDSGYSESSSMQPIPSAQPSNHRSSKSIGKTGAMVYGIVMYDFAAERADELEAKAGEAIIVIAQSNPEWFVAKPIGRLGGPGLIPVSFVEIRDMATDKAIVNPSDAIKQAGVPKVEEWKKMAAEYKNSSITLGKFEGGGPPGQPGQPIEQGMERMSLQQQPGRQSTQNGAGHVSEPWPRHEIRVPSNADFICSNKRDTPISERQNNLSKAPMAPSRPLSSMPPCKHRYPDIVLPMTSTGSSSKLHSRMVVTGNYHDITRISTTFRLHS